MQLDDPFTQPVITAEDVRANTPSDDDDFVREIENEDDESEVDGEGRYIKHAKARIHA
jgi:hypothetical protein